MLSRQAMIKWGVIGGALLLSAMIAFLSPSINFGKMTASANSNIKENSLVQQEVLGILTTQQEVVKVYNSGELIGVVQDYNKIEQLLQEVYTTRYEADFPNTKMGLGEDIYVSKELSSFNYENVDEAICDYLRENDHFAIETNSVEFSDENGVYATIYVKNIEDFYQARDRYLLNFISEEALALISRKQATPELKTYGSRELGIDIMEMMTVSKALASPSKIKTSMEEVFTYLCYGDDPTPVLYTVEEYDTIEGVGSKNEGGLSAQQIVTINPGVLTSTEQVLEPGMELNVRYFDSPINVVVTKELITREVVYPEATLYQENPDLREGLERVKQVEEVGSKNVKYEETWINGVLVKGVEVSSMITQQPVQGIIEYGTKYVPGIGTGRFRWPVDNPSVTCGWYCYSGHRALDIKNSYNRYGNIYAADNGTVVENSYHRINGYYMIISHGNGYRSYYGHMNRQGFFPVGTNVQKGEIIGQIGMTGTATGPHVHFYIEYNGSRSNPRNYLP